MWFFALVGCSSLCFLSASVYLVYRQMFLPVPALQAEKQVNFHFPLSYTLLWVSPMFALLWWVLYIVLLKSGENTGGILRCLN